MFKDFSLLVVQKLINQLIDCDQITRQQLNQLQGQLLRIEIASPALHFNLYFDEHKIRLDRHPSLQPADATLKLDTAVHGLQLLKMGDDDFQNIPIEGNYQLLFQLQHILKHSHFDLASTLSPYLGHHLATPLRTLQSLPKYGKQTLSNAEFLILDSLRHDSHLFASQWQMDDLQHSLLQLNQRIDRLNVKLDLALQDIERQQQ